MSENTSDRNSLSVDQLRSWAFAVGAMVFGEENLSNRRERLIRFAEEAMELLQAGDIEEEQAVKILRYVYARPKEPLIEKEFAGSFITLLTASVAHDVDIERVAVTEVHRVWNNRDRARAKHDAKPKEIKG